MVNFRRTECAVALSYLRFVNQSAFTFAKGTDQGWNRRPAATRRHPQGGRQPEDKMDAGRQRRAVARQGFAKADLIAPERRGHVDSFPSRLPRHAHHRCGIRGHYVRGSCRGRIPRSAAAERPASDPPAPTAASARLQRFRPGACASRRPKPTGASGAFPGGACRTLHPELLDIRRARRVRPARRPGRGRAGRRW